MIEIKINEQDAQVIQLALLELKIKDGLNTFVSIRDQLTAHYEKQNENK